MVGLPDGVALTSAFASQLLASRLHVTIRAWVLFLVILAAVAGLAYLGIGTSSWADLVLVAAEMAVIAALAITILTKASPANLSADASSPHRPRTASGPTTCGRIAPNDRKF